MSQYPIKRTPEQGHTRACLARVIIEAIEELRDTPGMTDVGFRIELQNNTALDMADDQLRHGQVECTCPARTPHTCRSQCDGCHTWEHCCEAVTRRGDLLLCRDCAHDVDAGLPLDIAP